MKISNALHALVARKKEKIYFNKRLNCSIVNVHVLFFKRSGKEFHAAGPAQEKVGLPYVDSRHLGTSRSPPVNVFYRPDSLPVAHPTVSKHKGEIQQHAFT